MFFRFLKVITILILTSITACSNSAFQMQEPDPEGLTMHDNQAFLYHNYRREAYDPINNLIVPEKPCIESCVEKTLKIAIVPASFNSPTIAKEIENTISFIKLNPFYTNESITVVTENDPNTQIYMLEPDFIIGPLTAEDTILVEGMAHKINAPIFSLAPSLPQSGKNTYTFGYTVQSDISSALFVFKSQGYKNIALLAKNDDIGANLYKIISKEAKQHKTTFNTVEFFEKHSIEKYISRVKSSIKQAYYKNTKTGAIIEDNHTFSKQIVNSSSKKEGEFVTLKNGKVFEKKYRMLDILIVDADAESLPIILTELDKDPAFKDVVIIASPRAVESIVTSLWVENSPYRNLSHAILFPSHFAEYSQYATQYNATFHELPGKLSATLYETLKYTLELGKATKNKHNPMKMPPFVGINGTMVLNDNKTVTRFVNISKLENGKITEIVDTYRLFQNMEKKK